MSNSLWTHELQHIRLPYPSLSPGVLLKLMSIELAMPSNHHPLSPSSSLALNLSQHLQWVGQLVIYNELVFHIRWPKYWSFSYAPVYFQWIFRFDFIQDWMVWLFAVQGTLKSLLQHHSSKASILWHSASFMVQLSHPYMTTGKTVALTTASNYMDLCFAKWCLCFLICCLGFSCLSLQGTNVF